MFAKVVAVLEAYSGHRGTSAYVAVWQMVVQLTAAVVIDERPSEVDRSSPQVWNQWAVVEPPA